MWSLDLITWTWSQIVPAVTPRPRHGHNCNIIGANMIVFGGAAVISNQADRIGYVKDIQVYDVMASAWMSSYAPKQDTTPTSSSAGGNDGGSGGISTGAIIGIAIGVVAILGAGIGIFIYRRRQKRLEIREAEMEKEAYLASLRPEGGDNQSGKQGQHGAAILPGSTSVVSTPGMTHAGAFSGMDELLLSNAAASPAMSGQSQGNVQYLMQHLPDGTIAVQPVYLDHHSIQSPNMGDDLDQGYISPHMGATNNNNPYFSPPQSSQAYPQASHVTYPQQSYDPFASPAAPNVPLPPGYGGAASSNGGNSGVGSPQRMAEQLHHH
ncbi:hypothetical protein BGZ76_005784 [Entomortierella beljakovae]|nr:hypothetical protein BGZ76_005784 [Entomortierella beljakovae]